MRHVTYAFLGPEESAARLAKKGTATDITLYNAKAGDAHLNLVTPSRFPEKITSLLLALDLCDEVILQPAAVDRALGEMVVGAELFGKTQGFARAQGTVDPATLADLLSKTGLRGLALTPDPEGVFRERLYERATDASSGSLVLPVDHAFPVKGVGTVILGLVRTGSIRPHDKLQAYPGPKMVDVRSVQVHDVDVPVAGTRSRVGLAVKGVEPADVNRGTVLAPPGSVAVRRAGETWDLTVHYSKFSKWSPRAGAVLHLFHVLQDVVVRVEAVAGGPASGTMKVRLDADLAHVPGQPMVLVDVDNKAQRFVGRASAA